MDFSVVTQLFMTVVGAALGLVLGSFVTAVSYRLPRNISIIQPDSFCPACNTKLAVRDLVPVFSWFAAKGQCRACRTPIPRRYPMIELLCMSLCALLFNTMPIGFEMVIRLGMVVVGMAIAVIDLEQQKRVPALFAWLLALSAIQVALIYAYSPRPIVFAIFGFLAAGISLIQAVKVPYKHQILWLAIIPLALAVTWFDSYELLRFIIIAGVVLMTTEYLHQENEIEQRYLLASLMVSWMIVAVS